jgi:hypothetical protein
MATASKKASKSASKTQASSQDGSSLWKWVYVIGVLVAGVTAAIGFENMILSWVLLLAGLLVGFLYFDSADVQNFGLRYLILWAVVSSAPTFLAVTGMAGGYITGFFTGFFNFLGPVVLAQIIMYFWNKYFASSM